MPQAAAPVCVGGGQVAGGGRLHVRVTAIGEQSALSGIMRLDRMSAAA